MITTRVPLAQCYHILKWLKITNTKHPLIPCLKTNITVTTGNSSCLVSCTYILHHNKIHITFSSTVGLKGSKGDFGARGYPGHHGTPGETGAPGAPGTSGTDGIPGVSAVRVRAPCSMIG